MGINTNGLFNVAQTHLDGIHRELKTQSEFLRAIASTDVEEEAETFRWLKSQGTCDATGQVQLPMENRTGFALELVSFSAVAGSASNGVVLFYLNSAEPQNLIWSAPQTQYNSDKFTSGMIVPTNGYVVAQFQQVGNAQLVFANLLARRTQIGKTLAYAASQPGW